MLDNTLKKQLITRSHPLKPTVMIAGKGLTENVLTEIELALNAHELIKVKIIVSDRELKGGIIESICAATGAEKVMSIGHIVSLYRAKPAESKKPAAPKKRVFPKKPTASKKPIRRRRMD